MSAPVLEPEAARLYQQIGPVTQGDAEHGYAAAHLCAVLMAPIERVVKIATEQGDKPGYSRMMNVNDADVEDLPWLGQFNGTPLIGSEPIEEQRRMIREARGSHRGAKRAIVSDVQATLTGEKTVDLIERAGSAFENVVVTRPAQTPREAATLAVLNDRSTKPLGAMYELIVTDTWIVAEVEEFEPSVAAVEALGTVRNVEIHGVI
jgi:hypothetical protein